MAGNYFVQAGPLDSRARKWPLPDDLIGEFIRYVVAHEVGHALGLAGAPFGPALDCLPRSEHQFESELHAARIVVLNRRDYSEGR
jgi:hypothetical protein